MEELTFEEVVGRKVSVDEVKEILIDYYPEDLYESFVNRELIVSELENSHGLVGTIVYSLNGSPAKGYAVYIPEYKMISFFNNRMKKFGEFYDVYDVEVG